MRFLLTLLLLVSTSLWATSHHPQDFLNEVKGRPDEGRQIADHYCANCHAIKPLIELGAPKMGQAKDWEPRLKAGLELLFQRADTGMNAMPARGGCFECSDKQLKLAILALLPEDILRDQKLIKKFLEKTNS
ncbi:cytochrome c5 family protein [Legionella taurinensis]|uniref:Cytochrome c5 family protein n=1 Tax=Legionella taurinensis TaxID=70611 RepID=A0A3A5LCX8_9GAMM|nr:c-type cytochrome [Legionella taurinensis]MDX1836958.1 c-type cytochrome [Legionella taurinensis]PUT41367.1 cytochrome c5 family protein [Legionella taurinensis]PUT42606.1 cytochrome c5 family protein [Legionella taurinensis]PUT46634.1 cytochrome c5 family protein [Legionella taurinensis]PUT47283.1 cytochrome c5 family protein [Legionella taurinensis]